MYPALGLGAAFAFDFGAPFGAAAADDALLGSVLGAQTSSYVVPLISFLHMLLFCAVWSHIMSGIFLLFNASDNRNLNLDIEFLEVLTFSGHHAKRSCFGSLWFGILAT